jgi:hypothetical protein
MAIRKSYACSGNGKQTGSKQQGHYTRSKCGSNRRGMLQPDLAKEVDIAQTTCRQVLGVLAQEDYV